MFGVYHATENSPSDIQLGHHIHISYDLSCYLSYEQVIFGKMIWQSKTLTQFLK
ncbi:unnamed protein product [marine sediment metagenome]|uniref:Uncharacterized protein n=1 Tax=marine sediment metagenome TaxID=412755 RepID=X0Y259_9ZZZZ